MDFYIDAKLLTNKKDSHEYLAKVFKFPEYYGKNLDALNDCLDELNDPTIHILNADEAGDYYNKVLPILEKKYNILLY